MPNTPLKLSRIEEKFRELGRRKEGALIAYLTGGDPDLNSFMANSAALIEGGADIIEVGIPFSDPIADGPVIQASCTRAMSRGARPSGILDALRELSSQFDVPFVILSYYNPILAMGVRRFMKAAHESGVTGVVVPDMPVEEGSEFSDMASKRGIDCIRFAAPNTSRARLRAAIEQTEGFLYLVSLYGVTGPRRTLAPTALDTVKRLKFITNGTIPLAAGFGIAHPEHVSLLLEAGADGAIVGSALVGIVAQHLEQPSRAPEPLRTTVTEFKKATIRP